MGFGCPYFSATFSKSHTQCLTYGSVTEVSFLVSFFLFSKATVHLMHAIVLLLSFVFQLSSLSSHFFLSAAIPMSCGDIEFLKELWLSKTIQTGVSSNQQMVFYVSRDKRALAIASIE